jgi:hypothetical protein
MHCAPGTLLAAILASSLLLGVGGVQYWIAVEERFKGAMADTVEVRGGAGVWPCRYDFSVGQRYVVFAFQSSNTFEGTVNIVPMERCTPTAPLYESGETLHYLRTR